MAQQNQEEEKYQPNLSTKILRRFLTDEALEKMMADYYAHRSVGYTSRGMRMPLPIHFKILDEWLAQPNRSLSATAADCMVDADKMEVAKAVSQVYRAAIHRLSQVTNNQAALARFFE